MAQQEQQHLEEQRQVQQDQTAQRLQQAQEQECLGRTEPETDEDAEREIDDILARLESGIAQERKEMDVLLSRLRASRAVAQFMALSTALGRAWRLARRVEELFELQRRSGSPSGLSKAVLMNSKTV
jgi:hypothetical protein